MAQALAVYDLDRTLTRRGSWLPWLAFWVRREAPWRILLSPLLVLAALAHGLGLIDRGALKSWAHRLMIGRWVDGDRLAAAAIAFAGGFAAHDVFGGARTAIAADCAAGKRILIASASHAYYVRAIAAELGVTDVVATEAVRAHGRVGHRLVGANCYGPAKRAAVMAWMAAHGMAGARLDFTSDHVSDLPCFALALESGGNVRAANASAALRAHALAHGWEIADWGAVENSLFERA